MKLHAVVVVFLGFCLLLPAVNIVGVFCQSTYQVQSTNLTLYRDGLVHCRQAINLDTSLPEITLPLLSESPQNILLLDENATTVDYKATANNLTAYTLGAKSISLEYDTMLLTRKEAEVWTLVTNYQYNMTVFLPQNSTIVYLNEIPLAIETKESKMALSLTAGNWEISYILPTSTPITPTSTPINSEQPPAGFKIEYVVLIIIVSGVIAIFGFIFFKRKRGPKVSRILKANPQLGTGEQEVIEFLIQKEGKAFEAELREKFPGMPRTSLWRLVRRLERLDIVEVKKIGLENQVQLKK